MGAKDIIGIIFVGLAVGALLALTFNVYKLPRIRALWVERRQIRRSLHRRQPVAVDDMAGVEDEEIAIPLQPLANTANAPVDDLIVPEPALLRSYD
ncbi:hypothetical protein H2203_006793 [Taxawa tesnikishii (nom. ined.)]|nr:hypothetical protein H2203_006793 [Dothideales sp. JES 119]